MTPVHDDVTPPVPAVRPPIIEARDVHKRYGGGLAPDVHALRGVTFSVDHGEHLAIVGPSGSGKSTLLNLLGALDRPTEGVVRFEGEDVRSLDGDQLAELRNRRIGFVFQSFQLLPRTTALDNVALPLVYRSLGRRERTARARQALEAVGLADRLDHRPTELSGGQQQRVAIARALVTEPDVLLADEPTGNLDTVTGSEVMGLLERLNRERQVALLVITHDEEVASRARRRIELRDGRIVTDQPVGAP
ncbi:MAG TPA: ABC transporter ATP-binding protein [Nitriliruptorales bacterium]